MKSTTTGARSIIPGSEKAPTKGAKRLHKVDPDERFDVTVRLRAREVPGDSVEYNNLLTQAQSRRQPMSREEFAQRFGADPADIEKLEAFAHDNGLDVVQVSIPQRTLRLSGTAQAMQQAFGVQLTQVSRNKIRFRHRTGSITVPREIAALVEGVFGLDNMAHRPASFSHQSESKREAAPCGQRSLL